MLLTANIVVEDAYIGDVLILEINKTGIKYYVIEAESCYDNQEVPVKEIQSLEWKDDSWYIVSMAEEIKPSLSYEFIKLVAKLTNRDVNEPGLKELVCKETSLFEEAFDGILVDNENPTKEYDHYSNVLDLLGRKVDINLESIGGRKLTTAVLGNYIKELEEAEEAKSSDDLRRQFHAASKEDCLDLALSLVDVNKYSA